MRGLYITLSLLWEPAWKAFCSVSLGYWNQEWEHLPKKMRGSKYPSYFLPRNCYDNVLCWWRAYSVLDLGRETEDVWFNQNCFLEAIATFVGKTFWWCLEPKFNLGSTWVGSQGCSGEAGSNKRGKWPYCGKPLALWCDPFPWPA